MAKLKQITNSIVKFNVKKSKITLKYSFTNAEYGNERWRFKKKKQNNRKQKRTSQSVVPGTRNFVNETLRINTQS